MNGRCARIAIPSGAVAPQRRADERGALHEPALIEAALMDVAVARFAARAATPALTTIASGFSLVSSSASAGRFYQRLQTALR